MDIDSKNILPAVLNAIVPPVGYLLQGRIKAFFCALLAIILCGGSAVVTFGVTGLLGFLVIAYTVYDALMYQPEED